MSAPASVSCPVCLPGPCGRHRRCLATPARAVVARPRSQARGFLMVEALVAASLLSIVLVTVLSAYTEARSAITRCARQDVASNLARTKLSHLASGDLASMVGVTNSGYPAFVPTTGPVAGMEWRWTVNAVSPASTPSIPSNQLLEAQVEVRYRVTHGTASTKTVSLRRLFTRRS